ncbi:Hypothetical predicted protein, partial [Olea europaea subsp. europaea]
GEVIGTFVVELEEAPSFSVGDVAAVGRNAELVVLPGPDSEQLLSGSLSRSWTTPPGIVVPPDRWGRNECTLAMRRLMSSSALIRSVAAEDREDNQAW